MSVRPWTVALSSLAVFLAICGSFVEIRGQSSSTYQYLGCYEDRNDIRLYDEVKLQSKAVVSFTNPDNCLAECSRLGRIYGGVSGDKCFCSDDYPSVMIKTINSECDTQWLGQHPEFARTPRPRLAAYETGRTVNNTYPAKIYMGCYREEPNAAVRILKGSWQTVPTNSPNTCHKLCLKTGFRYFGLTYREECFCGETPPPESALVDNEDCNLPCPGDQTLKCGGGWIQSIYATGITDTPSHGRYVGCYKNPEDDESYLAEFKLNLKVSNSPRRCLNICEQKGYQYAAVQNREQCLCGDQIPPNGTLDAHANCNPTKCPGDASDFCGSKSNMRLFRTRKNERIGAHEYLGCYATFQENSIMTASRIILPATLTTDVCIAICKERGFPIAGVIFGKNCHCDYYFGSLQSSVNDDECRTPCAGDVNDFCGAPSRYRLFFTGLPRIGTLPASVYKGCFRDDEPGARMLKGSWQELENNSPRVCQLQCYRTGYLFFGVTWKKECFCGNENPSEDKLVDESECNTACNGDPAKMCGGGWRTSIYSTGLVEMAVGDHYLGCYDDSKNKHILADMVFSLTNTNSPSRCMSICDQNGYRFAGVKRGADCYCGNYFYPEQHEREGDENCNVQCPGDSIETCGRPSKMKVYSTTVTTIIDYKPVTDLYDKDLSCIDTYSTKNKQKSCKGAVLFNDTFDTLEPTLWRPERKIAVGPDYQFVTYTCAPENVGVANGKLYIKPILQPDNFVNGKISISNCTGRRSEECSQQAVSFSILPPITTSRITTANSFSFRYGIVDVRAKFPLGDWIVGEIWLVPKDNGYGDDYMSGQIRIAMVRGNKILNCNGKDLGNKILEVGVYVGLPNAVKQKTFTKSVNEGWTNAYHNYTLIWTPENLIFSVDGEQFPPIIGANEESIVKVTNQPSYATSVWRAGGLRLSPFDREFYVSLGVSVGGRRDFADDCVSGQTGTVRKPWSNEDSKAMLNFWRARKEWLKTWQDKTNIMNVDHVKVTAL